MFVRIQTPWAETLNGSTPAEKFNNWPANEEGKKENDTEKDQQE
jgi:hypothetical protein